MKETIAVVSGAVLALAATVTISGASVMYYAGIEHRVERMEHRVERIEEDQAEILRLVRELVESGP